MRIAMIGTGYVGLVSGVCFSDFGHEVVCVDKDPSKMTDLAKWVVEQRKEGRRLYKGKITKMTPEQYKSLDGIHFNWNGPRPSIKKQSQNK